MSDLPVPLNDGETLMASFTGNRGTYIREHVMLAALGSVAMTGLLIWMDNPHPWVGVVGAVLAIAARGFYAASEQLTMRWHLTDRRLIGPDGRTITLAQVDKVRSLFSAVQVITRTGDKYLIKYLADTGTAVATISAARDMRKGAA